MIYNNLLNTTKKDNRKRNTTFPKTNEKFGYVCLPAGGIVTSSCVGCYRGVKFTRLLANLKEKRLLTKND